MDNVRNKSLSLQNLVARSVRNLQQYGFPQHQINVKRDSSLQQKSPNRTSRPIKCSTIPSEGENTVPQRRNALIRAAATLRNVGLGGAVLMLGVFIVCFCTKRHCV